MFIFGSRTPRGWGGMVTKFTNIKGTKVLNDLV